MAPGRANGLHVGVVGDEECWPVLRGAHKAAIGSPQSRLPLEVMIVYYVGDTQGDSYRGLASPAQVLGPHPKSLWRRTPGVAAIRSNVPSAVLRRGHVHVSM